jgi:hypothetical protein
MQKMKELIKTSGIYVPENIDEEFPLSGIFNQYKEVVAERTKRISNYTLY